MKVTAETPEGHLYTPGNTQLIQVEQQVREKTVTLPQKWPYLGLVSKICFVLVVYFYYTFYE